MNRFMKLLFDNNGIEIPFPQLVVHTPKEDKK
jgi:small-conductance mechanosensitive channel